MQETKVVIRITPTEATIEVTGPPNVIVSKADPFVDRVLHFGQGSFEEAEAYVANEEAKKQGKPHVADWFKPLVSLPVSEVAEKFNMTVDELLQRINGTYVLDEPLWPGFPSVGPLPSTEPADQHTIAAETPANGVDGSDVPSKPTYRLTQESLDELPEYYFQDTVEIPMSALPDKWKTTQIGFESGFEIGVKRSNGIDWYEAVIDPNADDLPF